MKVPHREDITIVRCHRLGQFKSFSTKPRPIIFKLHWYGDRTLIWVHRKEVKGTHIYLSENLAPEIEQRRRVLYPIARKNGQKATVNVDKLIHESTTYTLESLHKLPAELDPKRIATPSKNDITAFYSPASPLSNYNQKMIKHQDGTVYSNTEQGYWHKCSLYHNDDIKAENILLVTTPHKAHEAAKHINILKESNWYQNNGRLAGEQMYCICKLKFQQHPDLLKFVHDTGTTKHVEASKHNKRWGARIDVNDPDIFNETKWMGENWMGEILQKIRSELH